MSVAKGALFRSDLPMAPIDVVALVVRIGTPSRIAVGGDNATARNFETIHNDEAAGRNNLRMSVKSHGTPRSNRQLGHFIAANKNLLLFAGDSLEGGGINHLLDVFDFTLHFLRGELQFVGFTFAEGLPAQPEQPGFEAIEFVRWSTLKSRD